MLLTPLSNHEKMSDFLVHCDNYVGLKNRRVKAKKPRPSRQKQSTTFLCFGMAVQSNRFTTLK